ncbi:unnamed protein product [Candidatus Paraburkholderia kirkii UZHbot1]|uniref:WGS project CAFE00000000 data, contig bkir_c196 n=1 Tax=Candidatus Paraburkholderia kirkii UZHbot1 TaxID=1055526 RepID=U3UAT0_9BURK|nr:unnamed protein product [Candidatus Paraburkholderia kirkii UZHbot1]
MKTAHGYSSGITETPVSACEAIQRAAREAMAAAAGAEHAHRRASLSEHRCELRVQITAFADLFCQWPTLERLDAVTLAFDAPSVEHVVRTLNCLSAMSFMLR